MSQEVRNAGYQSVSLACNMKTITIRIADGMLERLGSNIKQGRFGSSKPFEYDSAGCKRGICHALNARQTSAARMRSSAKTARGSLIKRPRWSKNKPNGES